MFQIKKIGHQNKIYINNAVNRLKKIIIIIVYMKFKLKVQFYISLIISNQMLISLNIHFFWYI